MVVVALVVTVGLAISVHITSGPPARNIGPGPGLPCKLPSPVCTAHCDDLVEMPIAGFGFVDDRLASEELPETSTSYLRRDFSLVVQYAAAKVTCRAATWNTGIGGPIAVGDMSEQDGATPGTHTGFPRHPLETHVDGLAIDIAYFQADNSPDNHLRAICPHISSTTGERYRCLAAPTRLDAWRTALFLGAFLESPRIRVIGIDGRAARPILAAFDELCSKDWITSEACARRARIQFETRNTHRGWFVGHHNHLHVAWTR